MLKKEKTTAVLGIGNALVDVINVLENDAVLSEFGLTKGSMTLVDPVQSRLILDTTRLNKRVITTGGSAANTIHALASLGGRCGYLGKIGHDELGTVFKAEFDQKKIKTHLLLSEKNTGTVMALVSPDSERTMATYLGAAADLKPEELTKTMFNDYGILYIEGYLVQDHQLIETAIDLARKEGLKIAIDLSSFNVVEMNLAFLKKLISEKVDIVFANEEEAHAFTGKNPEEALSEIASVCEIAVVKVGKAGSLIQRGNEKAKPGIIPANAIDTTGAGDNYAAGFLYGLTHGYSLENCGRIAALLSGKVVEVMGAKIPEAWWPGIIERIKAPYH
jgi:sugar/nucleoside kinase (ribokinase family)